MIKQNTPEWLAMRKNKIGASDAPVIMGVSPYETPYQLWEEKLDLAPAKKDLPHLKKGRELEELARLELEKMTGLFFLPEVKLHATLPWMMASLDCIDPEGRHVAEIKCPNEEDHLMALSGKIPEKYFPQKQHQLEVCQLENGYYFSFFPYFDAHLQKYIIKKDSCALVIIYRDDAYIKKMIEKEKQFWECLQEFSAPELTERDYIHKTDPLWANYASEWRALNDQIKKLEAREKQLREAIITMSEKKNATGGGIKLTRFMRKGNVDYSAIPELQHIELDKYRKNPIESYRISAA